MYSSYYINYLAKKAKTSKRACWTLGEILHDLTMQGYKVIQDKKTGLIEIKEKDVITCD